MPERKTPNDSILIKDAQSGLCGQDIANKYGISRATACRHLKRLGLNKETPIGKRGNKHSQWRGGRGIKTGYWTVYNPNHPRALNIGRVWEHVLVMEKHLGRFVRKDEPIHHIDMDRLNNDINNLYLCEDYSEHQKVHKSLDKVAQMLFKKGIIKFKNGRYHLDEN